VAQLFGTDGIRGIANTELTPELAVGLGRALVRTLREEGIDRPLVAVGRDPRPSGEMLEAALVAGVTSAGGDVLPLGILPTPGVAFLVRLLGANSGVMISASHNPVGDNGIKCFGGDGFKLTDQEEERIEELMQLSDEDRPIGAAIGRLCPRPGALDAYVDHLVQSGSDLSGLRVVVDCANGSAATVAPLVLQRLGCDVVAINTRLDGDHINDGCGSTYPEVIAAAVREHQADVGLTHDGDADRLLAADATGQIVDGDQILAILADQMHRVGGLDTVVTTVMTNLGFKHAMAARGIDVVETKVGDRYVLEAMREGGYPLGGEQSGHLILAEHATTGDGILTAVQLLGAVRAADSDLASLAVIMRRLPQRLINVREVDRDRLADAAELWAAVEKESAKLADRGRVLLRASGTEPLVRVMVEADTEDRANEVAVRLADLVRTTLSV